MLQTGGFYKEHRGRQLIAANVSRTVDFDRMTQEWILKVHDADILQRIYYKLSKQLEHHHKHWDQHRGKMLHFLPISSLLENPNCCAKVLPAVEFPNTPQKHKKPTA